MLRVSSCRSLPITTTHMSYNFLNTFVFPSFSLGLRTRPFRTPVLGASRRKAKQGQKQLVLCLCSFPPSSPYPSLSFALFSVPIPSFLTLFSFCLVANPFLSHSIFCRSKCSFEPFQLSFGALFSATGSSLSPLLSLPSILCSLVLIYFYSSVPRTQLFSAQKQTLSDKDPKRSLAPPK